MKPKARSNSPVTSIVLVASLIALGTPGCTGQRGFSAQDDADVRAALQGYVTAWLSNDANAVIGTLTDDIVLQPHHGVQPVVGAGAVRAFWFPEGPPTVVTRFSLEITAVTGNDALAYAWGRSAVAWDYDGQSFSNEGNALSILRNGQDGVWRIAHQIWNDPPNQVR